MNAYLQELLAKRRELDAQINSEQSNAVKDAVTQARALIVQFDLTPSDIFPSAIVKRVNKPDGRRNPPPKYRDTATGKTWSGRGRTPRWIVGDKAQYAIN